MVAVGAAWYSDRHKQRSPFVLFFMSLIAIGFIIVIAASGRGVPGVVYFGVFVAVIGKSSIERFPAPTGGKTTKANQAHRRYLPCFPG